MSTFSERTPPLSDERPWAQGWNDWLAFGFAANAFKTGEEGYADYERGKREASAAFHGKPADRA